MLCTELLRLTMDAALSNPSWDDLAGRLKPFIRRRVESEADVDDVVQDVLLRMHRGLPALRDETCLTAWMYRVARRSIADHGRGKKRHPVRSADELPEPAHEPFAEDEDAVAMALSLYVQGFVSLLPDTYREVIQRTELEGQSHKEVAEAMGLSVSAVKSRVVRGRAKLRELLEACCRIAVDVRGKVVDCAPHPLSPVPDCSC